MRYTLNQAKIECRAVSARSTGTMSSSSESAPSTGARNGSATSIPSEGAPSRSFKRAQRGFTLIEIMVVVAIIAILGATVVPLIMDRPNEARVVRAKNDIGTISSALELYRLDNFSYPSTEQGLQALVEKPTGDPEPANWKKGGYIQKLPKDPWGRDYLYISPGEGGDYDVVSLGNDGAEGGDDFDADISNWTD